MDDKNKKIEYIPTLAIPPGDTLAEALEERGMTQAELAKRINRPPKTINEIRKGKTAITAETALQLEQVFGIPARFWNNLESNYRDIIARTQSEEYLIYEIKEAKQYPYNEMTKWSWVALTRKPIDKVKNLLAFFGVTSLKNVVENQILASGSLYRISTKRKYSRPAIAAWLRRGTILGQQVTTEKFNAEKLKNSLEELRALTLYPPQIFQQKLEDILAGCGVALVLTPNLKNAPVNGVSRWLTPNKALIQLTIRHKYNDIFWFSLFHEIGHILLHEKKDFNVDFKENGVKEEREVAVDKFATDTLIPPNLYQGISAVVRGGDFSYGPIKAFAKSVGIHPAVVIGRLQHDKILPPNFNGLRERFEWVIESQYESKGK
ncbi:MAG: Plasmid maintenance system antidote protein, XRE family [Parcubacteria group bacterium GW2011_GWB1_40_14]|nr:MAG: Plasmid maintenance system antidote protein, XRE family [Parcubacteria group bacterium GW2011_GWB1_40_14]